VLKITKCSENEWVLCTDEHHKSYIANYNYEGNAKYAQDGCYLSGRKCAECKKKIVPKKQKDTNLEPWFCPTEKKPAWFCDQCYQKWKLVYKFKGGDEEKKTIGNVYIHVFCGECMQPLQDSIAPNTPRAKRNRNLSGTDHESYGPHQKKHQTLKPRVLLGAVGSSK
jgi:hypothetical protein